MGLDLKLLPLRHLDNMGGTEWGYSHDVLSLHRDSELFDDIARIPSCEIGPGANVTSYVGGESDGNTCYGPLVVNPYGDPVEHVSAGDLAEVMARHEREGESNAPARAYVQNLPPGQRVALWWC